MAKKAKSAAATQTRSRFWIVRVAHAHLRLMAAIALGVAIHMVLSFVPTTSGWSLVTRLLLSWDAALMLYLGAAAVMMARSSHQDIEKHSDAQDEGAFGLMVLTLIAVTASLGAIFAELAEAKGQQGNPWPYVLAVGTVILSWTFTHTIFALHYAYEFYGESESARGLNFPDGKTPDYWDFFYFAAVIGMTFQVSDVSIGKRLIRRAVTVHSVLSFFFNTTIIALTVNMAANAF